MTSDSDFGDKLVILARLSSVDGFFDFATVMDISAQLQNKGIDAFAERAPGALMDSPDAFYIKVPVSQLAESKELLAKILEK